MSINPLDGSQDTSGSALATGYPTNFGMYDGSGCLSNVPESDVQIACALLQWEGLAAP